MTAIETKQQLTKEYSGVKYILTSSMRAKLLLAVYELPKNLDELRRDLKKPSATILHGLKELESINLVRKANKYYELTSNGYLLTTNMIKLIENWNSLGKSEIFWDNHDLSDIPEEIIKSIYLLKDVQYVNSTTSDLSISFNEYIKLISKAEELQIVLPIYSENHYKHIIDLLKKGSLKKLELYVNEEIYNSINDNEFFKSNMLECEKVKITIVNKTSKVFLTCSDKFISLTLFFKDGHYDDSQILIGKDENAIKWGNKLLNSIKK